jgi:hypothetical protein
MLVDLDGVPGALAGGPDEERPFDGLLNLDEGSDAGI